MHNDPDQVHPLPQRVYLAAWRRLHLIDRQLAHNNFPTGGTLAALLGVDIRTVKRDIAFMRDNFNAPIRFSRRHNGYQYTIEGWCLPLTRLSEGELLAFFIAENALRLTGQTPEALRLKHALAKIAALLPDTVSINLSTLGENVSFQNLPFATVDPQILTRLASAAISRQAVEFDYYSPHNRQMSHRLVSIHLLHNFAGDWFIVSFDHEKRAFRDFHAGRLKNLKETEHEFQMQPDFDSGEYLKRGFFMMRGGRLTAVEIHFDAYQAQWIRERHYFHPDEKREDLPDGSLLLSFKIGEDGLVAVARFCLTYAGHCRVLKPTRLKKLVKEKLQKGMDLHQ